MTTFTIKVEISCGERTCASEPGVFCQQLGAKSFGTSPCCMFFSVPLYQIDGWVQRCSQCIVAESKST